MRLRRIWKGSAMSVCIGCLQVDAHGNLTAMNDAAEQLTGWPGPRATGKPLAQVLTVSIGGMAGADEATVEPGPFDGAPDRWRPSGVHTFMRADAAHSFFGHWRVEPRGALGDEPAGRDGSCGFMVLLVDPARLSAGAPGSVRPIAPPKGPTNHSPQPHGARETGLDFSERTLAGMRLQERETHMDLVLRNSHVIAFSMDAELRYTWVANPDPHFRAEAILGRRDDELLPEKSAAPLMAFKREVVDSARGGRRELTLPLEGRLCTYDISLEPLLHHSGSVVGLAGVVSDISDRKRAEREMQDTDRRKNEFLATLAHELRNPLQALVSAAGIIGEDRRLSPSGSKAAGVLNRQLQQMTELVEGLADLARITTGELVLRRTRLSLAEVIGRCVEACRARVDAREQQLAVELPPAPVIVQADATRLEQLVVNLLVNASKFTPRGGLITVRATQEAQSVRVAVIDTGCGIPAEMLDSIFAEFVQGDHPPDTPSGGLGIGLGLARRIVELHGGTIRAFSDGVGHGSEFQVDLPVVAQPSPSSSMTPPDGNASGGVELERVLVVAEIIEAAQASADSLRSAGFDVRCAYDAHSAVTIARTHRPTVLLLDLGLPLEDRLAVIREIRSVTLLLRPAVIGMAASGTPAGVRMSAKECDAHLFKPVELTTLVETVRSLREMPIDR